MYSIFLAFIFQSDIRTLFPLKNFFSSIFYFLEMPGLPPSRRPSPVCLTLVEMVAA